jgi:hypothetical protein
MMKKFENSISLKSQIDLQLSMTYMIMGTDRISKSPLKRVYVIMNGRSINCGFMKNVQNF